MLLINGYNKIINHLRWEYFIGEFKPHEKDELEKCFKSLTFNDQTTVREFRILLDSIHDNKELRDELGVNAYELYPIGLDCFINFNNESNPVIYKVHDLTKSKTLFNAKNSKGLSKEQIRKTLDNVLATDKNYIKNFSKGYVIVALPDGIDDKSLNINKDIETLGFSSALFDDKNKTLIIKSN